MYGRDATGRAIVTREIARTLADLVQVKAKIKALEAEEDAHKLKIQKFMGGKAVLGSQDGKDLVTWRHGKEQIKWDYKGLAEDFAKQLSTFLKERDLAKLKAKLERARTDSVRGPRRFLLKPAAGAL